MQSEITLEKVKSALRQVKFLHSKDNVIDDGDVSGIVLKDGHVSFSIEIDPKLAKNSEQLRKKAENAIIMLPGVLSATAIMTAHKNFSSTQQKNTFPTEKNSKKAFKTSKIHYCNCIWKRRSGQINDGNQFSVGTETKGHKRGNFRC